MPVSGMEMFTVGPEAMDAALKLLLACVLGSILGLERELTSHPAGLRTHVLVSLGSTCFMVIGFALARESDGQMIFDPLRVAQGIITGVGFIGAGTIIKEGLSVRGITTAASLWMASAVGIAVAAGRIPLAAVASLLCVATLIVSRLFGRLVHGKSRSGDRE